MSTFRRLQQLGSIQSQEVLPTIQPSHAIEGPDKTKPGVLFTHLGSCCPYTTLSILDAVQRRAIRLIGDPALTCHLQPLSHRRAVGDLSLFYRYLNGFYLPRLFLLYYIFLFVSPLH
nr:unnamed protein product [Callosobruchus chinensis]